MKHFLSYGRSVATIEATKAAATVKNNQKYSWASLGFGTQVCI